MPAPRAAQPQRRLGLPPLIRELRLTLLLRPQLRAMATWPAANPRSVRAPSSSTDRSRSGLRFGVLAAFASAAFFELSALRFFGATFAICAPVRGAFPFRGLVLACRCFLPILFF